MKFRVIVPHLEIEIFEVDALDTEDAIKVWSNAKTVLLPVESYTPTPAQGAPAPRAEMIEPDPVVAEESKVLRAEGILKCGKCGSPKVVPGTVEKDGTPVLVCTKCGAVGVGEKPGQA